MMRCLSSCFDVTRIWRRTERANLEKKPSVRLSQEPCLGVKVKSKPRPGGRVSSQARVSLEMCAGMIVENQLDRGLGRIGGIDQLEEFDELAAAVALPDERVNLAGEQIDPGQQAQCAMTFVFMIPRAKLAWRPGTGGKSGAVVAMAWIPGLLVVGDDRDRLLRFLPPWQRLFSGPGPRGRHTELPPSWARTRRRGVPDSSAPCAA